MIASAVSFARNRHLDFLLQDRLELADEADMGHSLLHHDGHRLGSSIPSFIHRIAQHIDRHTVPSHAFALRAHLFHQREVAIQLQIQRVMLPNPRMLRLVHDLTRDVQLRTLRVKVEVLDSDLQRQMHPR